MNVLKQVKLLIMSSLVGLTLPTHARPITTDSTVLAKSNQSLYTKKSNACNLFLTINSVTCDNKGTNLTTDDEVVVIATMTGTDGQMWELSRKVSNQFEEAVHLGDWTGDQTINLRINKNSAVAGYPPSYNQFELWYMIGTDCVGDVFVTVPECPCAKPDAGIDKEICLGSNTQLIGNPSGGNWSSLDNAIIDNNGNVSGLNNVGNYAFVYEVNGCKDTTIVTTTEPIFQIQVFSPTCKEIGVNDDGKIKLFNFAIGDKYQYSEGSFFNGLIAIPSLPIKIPDDGIIVSNLINSSSSKTYTVRVLTDEGCSKDTSVVIEPAKCCLKQICSPFLISKSR